MKKPLINTESYLDASHVFHWAYMSHYVRWFTGESKRHQRTEKVLKRLVRGKKLDSLIYNRKLIYGRKTGLVNERVPHGLACTECLVRIYRSDPSGVTIPEKYFRGLGSVPEWGIIYPDGKLLLFEFCTKSNFYFSGLLRGKLQAYKRNVHKIEENFQGKAVVLFVLDVDRSAVETLAGSVASAPHDGDTFPVPFYFIDYKSFLSVPFGSTKWKELCLHGS